MTKIRDVLEQDEMKTVGGDEAMVEEVAEAEGGGGGDEVGWCGTHSGYWQPAWLMRHC